MLDEKTLRRFQDHIHYWRKRFSQKHHGRNLWISHSSLKTLPRIKRQLFFNIPRGALAGLYYTDLLRNILEVRFPPVYDATAARRDLKNEQSLSMVLYIKSSFPE